MVTSLELPRAWVLEHHHRSFPTCSWIPDRSCRDLMEKTRNTPGKDSSFSSQVFSITGLDGMLLQSRTGAKLLIEFDKNCTLLHRPDTEHPMVVSGWTKQGICVPELVEEQHLAQNCICKTVEWHRVLVVPGMGCGCKAFRQSIVRRKHTEPAINQRNHFIISCFCKTDKVLNGKGLR